jgi:amino acid transporter
LFNGGTTGIIYSMIAVWLFVMFVIASMGKLASMALTAGGQYHFISELAPRPIGCIRQWNHGHHNGNYLLVCPQICSHRSMHRVLTIHSFCITDLDDLLAADTDYPIIQIIYRATGSYGGTCILGSLLILLLFFLTVTTVASASRQVWAFSRDRGFPFSSWISHVRPSWEIPANAVSAFGTRTLSAETQLTTPRS